MNNIESEIFRKFRELRNEEDKLVYKVREKFRKDNKDLIDSLRQKCEREIGHSWRSTGYNITHEVENFVCTICLKHKSVELE